MSTSQPPPSEQNNMALWITVTVEALVIIAAGAYNIYEIRRHSELVQTKIERLADFSARQGEKVDRMMTVLELYAAKRFDTNAPAATNSPVSEERLDKAIEFLQTLKKKE